jgi:hypothetical protein
MSSAVALPLPHWGRMRSIFSLVGCLLGLGLCGAAPAAAECPNEALRYGYGAYLPDCRAYEQVSPADKGGAAVTPFPNAMQASPDGDSVLFWVPLGLPGIEGSTSQFPIYVASRGADGWSTRNLLPAASASWDGAFPASGVDYLGWSPDLTAALFYAQSVPPLGKEAIILGNDATGGDQVLALGLHGDTQLDGFSADDSRVVFEEEFVPLLSGAAPEQDNVYEWDQATGKLYLVGVLPDGTAPAAGSWAGPYNADTGNTTAGGAIASMYTQSAVSSDGSRVFFTAAADAGRDAGTAQVFVRENPTTATASTVQVSASQKTNGTGAEGTDANGPQPAAFRAATPDGSQVLFTSPEALTNDATTGTADQGDDLYDYDLTTGGLTDLTPDTSDANGAEVQGVLGISSDGSYVYFVANGVLAPGATAGTCRSPVPAFHPLAEEGVCNLYLWHNGATTFIGQLNAATDGLNRGDSLDWKSRAELSGAEVAVPNRASVTPDGRTLLFVSEQQLTAYDNLGYDELYRYSAPTGQLLCVSCDPSGAAPRGPATLEDTSEPPIGEGENKTVLHRNLSGDGSRVFFDSEDPLLPAATDGVDNVYEWEADGSGSCQSTAENGGCLYLISSGSSPDPSYFLDASESGNDVFFFTDQQLVGSDTDQLVDVYDARVDGGLAGQTPTVQTSSCSGEGCLTAPPPAPLLTQLTSTAPSGAGNLAPSSLSSAKPPPRPLTRAQKLARALKECRTKRSARKRHVCDAQARRLYGPPHKGKRAGHGRG